MSSCHPSVLIGLALLGGVGCWNGSHNEAFVESGGRFALEIETSRSDVVGTHFLVDTATGDLWRLDARGAESPIWVRIADGPPDAQPLEQLLSSLADREDEDEE